MSKFQIAKFIDNNELDLSLQSLTDIPIKEIIKFPKIKSIDLSCNALEQINPNIGQLTNITRLDLSKNKIQSLPSDIGKLVNLEYLDLRSNKLTDLPASMCSLKKLKWLDLKDNPLNVNLGKAAGDCLDRDKCEKCAVNVLEYLSQLMSKVVKKNQKKKRKEDVDTDDGTPEIEIWEDELTIGKIFNDNPSVGLVNIVEGNIKQPKAETQQIKKSELSIVKKDTTDVPTDKIGQIVYSELIINGLAFKRRTEDIEYEAENGQKITWKLRKL